jgi:hypothetical protein
VNGVKQCLNSNTDNACRYYEVSDSDYCDEPDRLLLFSKFGPIVSPAKFYEDKGITTTHNATEMPVGDDSFTSNAVDNCEGRCHGAEGAECEAITRCCRYEDVKQGTIETFRKYYKDAVDGFCNAELTAEMKKHLLDDIETLVVAAGFESGGGSGKWGGKSGRRLEARPDRDTTWVSGTANVPKPTSTCDMMSEIANAVERAELAAVGLELDGEHTPTPPAPNTPSLQRRRCRVPLRLHKVLWRLPGVARLRPQEIKTQLAHRGFVSV